MLKVKVIQNEVSKNSALTAYLEVFDHRVRCEQAHVLEDYLELVVYSIHEHARWGIGDV